MIFSKEANVIKTPVNYAGVSFASLLLLLLLTASDISEQPRAAADPAAALHPVFPSKDPVPARKSSTGREFECAEGKGIEFLPNENNDTQVQLIPTYKSGERPTISLLHSK